MEIAEKREKITGLFTGVGNHYMVRGLLSNYEVYDRGSDSHVHAYYFLSHNQGRVVHLAGSPEASTDEAAWVNARIMDRYRLRRLRSEGLRPGEEHKAAINKETARRFRNFGLGLPFPYGEPERLQEELKKACRELREKKMPQLLLL